jgi:Ca2+-transporting ATPase
MTTLHRADADAVLVCLKGAPEAVLDARVLADRPEVLEQARARAAGLAADGYRVLAVAGTTRAHQAGTAEEAETGLDLLGLVAMSDPPKTSAADTLAACRRAGITPVMITGDHPATAAAIATRLGLLPNVSAATRDEETGRPDANAVVPADRQVVTGEHLAKGEIGDLTRVRVFARTSPAQKLDIIEAWHAANGVTAMTGDGVNDAPALRRADIGVAMGNRGTEVARQAADLVLADDDLATVVTAVEEGRRIYDNIRRFLLYALSGGAAEILVMLLGPVMGLSLPLRAGQILWINLLTHGLTGVAMGAEPASATAMTRAPRPPQEHILGAGLWNRVLVFAALITAVSLGAGVWVHERGEAWQSILFLALLTAQLGVCFGLRERWWTRQNPFLPLAVVVSLGLALAALYLPALSRVLHTEPLTGAQLLPALFALLVGLAAGRGMRTRNR